ncbi:hypothetical protein [Paenibacillus uliginis]|uniref:hypothetical protein n=1 Tax=Paenibacillus uliginis TaxID=683737 RepID=UPI001AD7EF02|nr:hypothetical protein [Paenibacillus uliginis]
MTTDFCVQRYDRNNDFDACTWQQANKEASKNHGPREMEASFSVMDQRNPMDWEFARYDYDA